MFGNTLILALRAIRRNVMRSILTILGIVIGVAAVMALVTIGQGATAQVQAEIGSMGENLLMMHPGGGRRGGGPPMIAPRFELADVDAIAAEISGLQYLSPASNTSALVVSGNANWTSSVIGTSGSYLPSRGYELQDGRAFDPQEESAGRAVCIIGQTTAEKLFDNEDPLGERIRVGKASCVIIGLLASKGHNAMGQDQDDVLMVPIRFLMRRLTGNTNVSSIVATVEEGRSTQAVRAQIQSLMRQRRRIAPGAEDNFRVDDLQEVAAAISQTTAVMTGLLAAIAAVSLLVGGIGIMNIMLVSVTERTREIGIRLAIGAFRADVLWQFLIESAVLSGFGGILGLLVGTAGAFVTTHFLKMPFVPSGPLAVIAFVFSLIVGVLFGYWPAWRASRLNPIEALRHE